MYENDTRAEYVTGSTSPSAIPKDRQPLTHEVMSRTGDANEATLRILARLHEMRDRLFGPAPANNANGLSIGREGPPASFADSYASAASDLNARLISIDQLTHELASRI